MNCDAHTFEYTGGSVYPVVFDACLKHQTTQRIDIIKRYYSKQQNLPGNVIDKKVAKNELIELDKRVNELINILLGEIDRRIARAKYNDEKINNYTYRDKIVKSQELWITYRNLNCDAVSHLFSGNDSIASIRDDCMIQMTKQRIDDLESGYKTEFLQIDMNKELDLK
jgi:uncharacterized protein YecT (DUF1311 family)